ncbi:MAG: aspartate/glutamate racemase family protein [Anaerolineaceae bacterium]|jgi:allantoin racemase|nr:aspartate/glutamate racemase family protein [Anaerolineaceae bacterium]
MRILFVNPNTSEEFTRRILDTVTQYALASTIAAAKNPDSGPRSIEGVYDELLSVGGTLKLLKENMDHFDAFVIACFSDHPVIYALREITDKPVLGIAEASMYFGCMLGHKFSVVTTNDRWEPLLWEAVKHYGLQSRCASIRTTRMAVSDLESLDDQDTYSMILREARAALDEDSAEVICLGCAGMSGLDKRLEKELQVPVLDGVVCALKLLEGLLGYGVHTSKKRLYFPVNR